jgi:hypothetical protein
MTRLIAIPSGPAAGGGWSPSDNPQTAAVPSAPGDDRHSRLVAAGNKGRKFLRKPVDMNALRRGPPRPWPACP